MALGVAGFVCGWPATSPGSKAGTDRAILWAAFLIPVYVALQLLPLPVAGLRLLSPARAALTDALAAVGSPVRFAPTTIQPFATAVQLSRVCAYVLVFLLAREAVRRSASRWTPALPLLIVGGLEAVWGLLQIAAGADHASGSYTNRDHFVGLLEMMLPLALICALALLPHTRRARRHPGAGWLVPCAAGLVAAAAYLAAGFSLGRMGFISIHISLFMMGALAVFARVNGWRRWSLVIGLAFAVALAFVWLSPTELITRFGGLVSGDAAGRWSIWKNTLRVIAAYPLVGSGLGTYFPVLLKYQTSGLNVGWVNAHNDYLQFLAELGVVGLVAPTVLLGLVLARAARTTLSDRDRDSRLFSLACLGAFAAICAHSFTDFNLYVPANAMVFSWIVGMASAATVPSASGARAVSPAIPAPPVRNIARMLAGGMTIYGIGWLIFLSAFSNNVRAEPLFCDLGICDAHTLDVGGPPLDDVSEEMATTAMSPAAAMSLLRRDPAAPDRWEDLGDALRRAGRIREARLGFATAVSLGPHVPAVLFRAATFSFETEHSRDGLALMARTLEADSAYAASAFSGYEERGLPIDDVLRYGVPNQAAGHAYLRKLLADDNARFASIAWSYLVSKGWIDARLADEYINALLAVHDYDSAAHSWAAYVGARGGDYLKSNQVFNGDFEQDPTPGPLDWRLWTRPGLTVAIDSQIAHSGQRSVRIRFDGTENVGAMEPSQNLFVPAGRYRFSAFVKTDGLTTDQGVFFRISATDISVTTEPIREAAGWRLVESEFQVPSGARLVELRLARRPSLKFDNQIAGTLWVDDVKIAKLGVNGESNRE